MDTIPSWIIRQLREVPDLSVSQAASGVLRLSLPNSAPVEYEVHRKRRFSHETAEAFIAHHDQDETTPLLLATRRLTEQTRNVLEQQRISWVEKKTGIVRLFAPGIRIREVVKTESESSPTSTHERPTRLSGKSGLYAEALLSLYQDEPIKVRESANQSGISPGMAARILQRLQDAGIVRSEGAGPQKKRWLQDPAELLDLWSHEEDQTKWTRYGLNVWTQTTQDRYHLLRKELSSSFEWAIRGTAAANSYAPSLASLPDPEIWILSEVPVQEIADALGGDIVQSGANVRVWQHPKDVPLQFAQDLDWDDNGVPLPLVSPFRAYVEARMSGARGPDVATRLRSSFSFSSSTSEK